MLYSKGHSFVDILGSRYPWSSTGTLSLDPTKGPTVPQPLEPNTYRGAPHVNVTLLNRHVHVPLRCPTPVSFTSKILATPLRPRGKTFGSSGYPQNCTWAL